MADTGDWLVWDDLVSVPCGLSSSSRVAQTCSHGCGSKVCKVSWGPASEQTNCYFCHILLAKASQKASPDLSSGKIDCSWWKELQTSIAKRHGQRWDERLWLFLQSIIFFPSSGFLISGTPYQVTKQECIRHWFWPNSAEKQQVSSTGRLTLYT